MQTNLKNLATIRPVQSNDATALTQLALLSKAHWGYSAEFMAACHDELAVTAEKLAQTCYFFALAEYDTKPLGFYALECLNADLYEIEALFVSPEHMGSGVGRQLFDHACAYVRRQGGKKILIQSDPQAVGFYQAMGAELTTQQRESSSIPDRMLPVLLLKL